MQTVLPGRLLSAPGVLKNAVRVEALYDRDEAARATLTNLLQRQGYEDLDAVLTAGRSEGLAAGRSEGLASALIAILEARGLPITEAERDRVARCTDATQLAGWVRRAAVVHRASETFEEG